MEQAFSAAETALHLAWHIADGNWELLRIEPADAQKLFADFMRVLHEPRLENILAVRTSLQQELMARKRGTFEAIQREAPFRALALERMVALIQAWEADGERALDLVWRQVFDSSWHADLRGRHPVRILRGAGRAEDDAVEFFGPDGIEYQVAAEWWYLRYELPLAWKHRMHLSMQPRQDGTHLSVHEIEMADGSKVRRWFLVPPFADGSDSSSSRT